MKHLSFIILLLLTTYNLSVYSRPKCFFEHYSSEDGLPQHSVTNILQDKKGFIWLSTWNGLSKFDGYNFHTYKIQQENMYYMRSNRIDNIYEDKYGYIWTLPYDREVHRFDPRTERFTGLRSLKEHEDLTFTANRIKPTESGKVWLLSDKAGCVCVLDSAFNVEMFSIENKKINGNNVYDVFEDSERNSWILTNNGLYLFSSDNKSLNKFFAEETYNKLHPAQVFYTAMETDDQILFGSNNGRIWIYNKCDEQFKLLETTSKSAIRFIDDIDEARIFIATSTDGFYIYHKPSDRLTKYESSNLPDMRSNKIISYYIDRSDNIWLETDCMGAAKFDTRTGKIKHFTTKIEIPADLPNMLIFEDKENRLWIHPRGGGFSLYDPDKEMLIPFYNEPNSPSWKFSNVLHAGFSDKQGNLWLSPHSHGLEKIIFNDDVFKSAFVNENIYSTVNNNIRCIFEDEKQNLWVSSKEGKIHVYNSASKPLGYVCETGTIGFGKPLRGITYCIFRDADKNIWVGTKGQGLYKLSPKKDSGGYEVKNYKNSSENLYSLSNDNIYSVFQDNQKRIWIGTYGGGLNLLDDSGDEVRFISYKNNLQYYPTRYGLQVRTISSDTYGNICVGTTFGLIMFSSDFASADNIRYQFYTRIPGNNESLSGNDIYDIFTTKDGSTYIVAFGGGINRITETDKDGFPVRFSSYTTQKGLPSDIALSIIEDSNGKLWITTEGNLTKFDPENDLFETYSEVSRLINGQNFSEGAKCMSRSGTIYFGYSGGFISVNPDKVKANAFQPYVALIKLQIANKDISIGKNSPLKESIDNTKVLKLNHKQNLINIEFAALDYTEPQKITYAYKLDGLDKEWIITRKQRTANYTNLVPGNYVFRVKSTNSNGVWTDNEHTLNIEITPSFWQTGWAYTGYLIVFALVFCIILKALFVFYRLKDKVVLEHEQTEMKTRFFTDISHEIRTPLTMIVSPVQNIIDDEETSDRVKTQLQLVLKNANRMLRMVNQILDFRKIQKQEPDMQETIIGEYVKEICLSFSNTAELQGLNLNIDNQAGKEKIRVDRDSIEKLIFNLLSNAFKHTARGKTIEVNIRKKENAIAIQVKDDGEGISKEMQNKLFARFVSFNPDKNKPSTGIGMSIVKEAADKHHAKITVESEPGKGTCVTVLFPADTEQFKENNTYELSPVKNLPKEDERETILVVEDDADLRGFIKSVLLPHYHVLEAGNGKEGYDAAVTDLPDFILSDIMMPEIDGVELLQKIRENNETSHIPFMLLTAKTNIESKITGLTYGADDYITKPFNVNYLKARIANIIQQRNRLYKSYLDNKVEKPVPDESKNEHTHKITPQDELFLQQAISKVEKNIDNSDFLVEDLVSEMAMSRSVFFRKLKSLTGNSPIEFIREIKIKHAGKLIGTQQYTIKEVAFMIGISDMKYFNLWFKRIMGMTPGEHKTKTKRKET